MSNCAIVGINWGDEGKGRMVDYLTQQYDVVVRYQGGGNAGHTVINEKGKFALHLLPSGIFRSGVMNILGNGVALDCENLLKEIDTVRQGGVDITPENLLVSERASLLLPWHRELDALEEARLADKKYGSTKQGIAPFYSDKYQKKTVLAGELLYPDHLRAHLQDLLEWKNLILREVYGAKGYTMDEMMAWVEQYGQRVKPYVADTGRYLHQAQADGKSILFEGQLGALRDLDYGIYPYTTSSNTIAAFAPVGSGLPGASIDEVVGVVKAYSSCVGEGPFVCEWFGADAEKLRDAGDEYGAKTGRPRRVGPIDLVATRYGVRTQNATNIALTKLDILSYMDRIPVCAHYEINGQRTDEFPFRCCWTRPSPLSSMSPAGPATFPPPAPGRICPRRPGTMWSMWSGPSAATSAMCPWAPSATASSSAETKETEDPYVPRRLRIPPGRALRLTVYAAPVLSGHALSDLAPPVDGPGPGPA